MKYHLTIQEIKSLKFIENYWTDNDIKELLALFNFDDVDSIEPTNLREMLYMAIQDFEPNEAASIVLTYKLADDLSEGQIDQISNDMLLDKISEEYPVISLHSTLYSINQLLHDAYNGKFPAIEATKLLIRLKEPLDEEHATKELFLRILTNGVNDGNIIKRLYEDQLESSEKIKDADSIIWFLKKLNENEYEIITSAYWLDDDDFETGEMEATIEKAHH